MIFNPIVPKMEPRYWLTFSSPESFTLAVNNTTKNWDGILEYSANTKDWSTWDGTTTLSSVDNKLYVRGTGNTKITGNGEYRWVLTGSNISCEGNIETLLDYRAVSNGEHPTMANACYFWMFNGCASLTTAPELPAITLTGSCYNQMFKNTSLTTAPKLPAVTLADWCYSYMFDSCSSLITAPELPATTLAMGCYSNMFRNCTSLTTIPKLPATTLTQSCYSQMFYECSKIKLSATKNGTYTQKYRIPTSGTGTTADYAVQNMFLSTGGTFTGNPTINRTYYVDSSITIV